MVARIDPSTGLPDARAGASSSAPNVIPTEKVAGLAPGLRKAARALEAVAVIGALLGVVGGLLVATASHDSSSGLFTETTTTHPYVGLGIAIIGAAIVQGLFLWAVARTMALVAAYSLERTEHDRALAAHAARLRAEGGAVQRKEPNPPAATRRPSAD